MTAYETVLTEEDSGIAVVTLNRPDRMNAYTWRLGLELRHAIATFDSRDDIRAIVVTGAGRAFCAGADLEGGGFGTTGADAEEQRRVAEELKTSGAPYWEMNTPIIAAMNGSAVGVGLTMPMQWDIRFAAEDAKYGFVFNRRGVIPELNAPWIVPRLVGLSRGMELLVTGRVITGREAAAIGLVSAAYSAADVLDQARAVAVDIATNVAPVSAGLVKRLVYQGLAETDVAASEHLNHRLFGWTARQPDAVEGPRAFLEKRDPQWKLSKNADFPTDMLGN